jgi:hypothetical protein
MLINWTEIIGFLAAGFELWGLYLIGKKRRLGFIINIAGGVTWIMFSAITKGAFGLIIVCSVAIVLSIKGFLYWGKV